ncbi:MAG: response regulator [Acidobacteria bacterium]|nr:response regulator [Acidobacteriota bacterium]
MIGQVDILIVEDDVDDITLALRALQREHLANRIFLARDGEQALDFLFCRGDYAGRSADALPKLVLLDLKLPRLSGIEILKQIKGDTHTRGVPVVILTSSKEERDLIASYNLGANSYIQKPVNFEQFRQTIKTLGMYWLVVNQVPAFAGEKHPKEAGHV